MAKSQVGAESLCLTDMGSCGVKKTNGCVSSSGDDSNRDSGVCYPSPYELTKLTCDGSSGLETVTLVRQTNGHTMPLKTGNGNIDSNCQSQEPMYATVKRTPRAPRNECHVYQYPLTLVTQDGSCFDTESCVSLTSCTTGPPSSTAYFRVQEDSDKPLSGELVSREMESLTNVNLLSINSSHATTDIWGRKNRRRRKNTRLSQEAIKQLPRKL